jgi:hypothetical protein
VVLNFALIVLKLLLKLLLVLLHLRQSVLDVSKNVGIVFLSSRNLYLRLISF